MQFLNIQLGQQSSEWFSLLREASDSLEIPECDSSQTTGHHRWESINAGCQVPAGRTLGQTLGFRWVARM